MHNVLYISMGISSFYGEALFLKEGTNDIYMHEICLCKFEGIAFPYDEALFSREVTDDILCI